MSVAEETGASPPVRGGVVSGARLPYCLGVSPPVPARPVSSYQERIEKGASPRGLGARSMEPLAVAGNGQYGYLDGLGEARRLVLGQLARLISSAADLQAASR